MFTGRSDLIFRPLHLIYKTHEIDFRIYRSLHMSNERPNCFAYNIALNERVNKVPFEWLKRRHSENILPDYVVFFPTNITKNRVKSNIITPVSYTHLDVYKRQLYSYKILKLFNST